MTKLAMREFNMGKWKSLYSIGEIGSEGGIISADEEYEEACRITIEKCPRYYAITCGIYGSMVHRVFRGPEDCLETYDAMKKELAKFIDNEYTEDEERKFYKWFCNKYD